MLKTLSKLCYIWVKLRKRLQNIIKGVQDHQVITAYSVPALPVTAANKWKGGDREEVSGSARTQLLSGLY
jgi:hypothetical protein